MKNEKITKMRKMKSLYLKMLSMVMLLSCTIGLSQSSIAQATLTTSEVQLQVDRDYVDEKIALLEDEIQFVRNNSQMDDAEKKVRIKILEKAGELVEQGVLIEDSWNIAYRILSEKIRSRYPNIPLKDYINEYKNKF
ncbi:MAG: hypothetical protein GVX96_02125 [Bacteroidetes bacterium]|jgi:hypothetical protein|nr:hypothetical protein [Bacteroidota bacterium]